MPDHPLSFQDLILRLHTFWSKQGCVILQPFDVEMGAGTFHPATTLRALGPKPWSAAYVQPSRRPTDGRYGENPNRLQHYYQYQVIMKPSPANAQDLLLASYRHIGLDPLQHDFRFVEDDWESPTLQDLLRVVSGANGSTLRPMALAHTALPALGTRHGASVPRLPHEPGATT